MIQRTLLRNIALLLLSCGATALQAQLSKLNTLLMKQTLNNDNYTKEYSVLVKGDMEAIIAEERNFGIRVNYHYGNIACVRGALANLLFLANTGMVQRMELPGNLKLRTMNDTMRVKNNIVPVQLGQAPLAQAYDGQGVIMGIIDSGQDYTHPDFKDSLTGKSRILQLWDQTFATASNTPPAFGYGQEWDSSYFNNNTCPHTDAASYGHGTHTAGTAAGNGGLTGKCIGVAPKAEFITVALDFNSAGPVISDAANYIFTKAAALGRPCVINASVGDYYGSHDGKDLQTQLIDNMLQTPGRLLVAAAGNAGSIKYHTGYTVSADTNFTWISNGTNSENFQVYAGVNDFLNVQYALGANDTSSYSDRGSTGFKNFSYALGTIKKDTVWNAGNRIGIVTTAADTAGGVYTLDITIDLDSTGYVWRFDATGSGKFDSWNFDYISSGLPSAAQYPRMVYYKSPDTLLTLVSGFQCSDNVITVGNYINMTSWYDVTNTLQTIPFTAGQISGGSSHGPTRDGRQKPDIAASGDQIFSTMVLSLQQSFITNAPAMVSQDSMHVMGGGTSSSSPVVAGLGALYLQMDSTATPQVFKQAITQCAKQDNFTGSALPDVVWGYGKLDGFAAMTCSPLGTITQAALQPEVKAYPNPASGTVNFYFAGSHGSGTISLYDAMGKKAGEKRCLLNETVALDLDGLGEGIYLYRITSGSGLVSSGKLVKQ